MKYITLQLLLVFLVISSYAEKKVENFSIIPSNISSISVQENFGLEELLIVLEKEIPKNLVPTITDSTVEFSILNVQTNSSMFRIEACSFAKGLAWSNGKLIVYLNKNKKPIIMIMKNRILFQTEAKNGILENWQALPNGLKGSTYFLPTYEPLASSSEEFAKKMNKKRLDNPSLSKTIQVKKSDASYIVTEDIASLFPTQAEGKPLLALSFGDRLKVVEKKTPFYKVNYQNKVGYVYQRDILQEAELTTSQKDKLRRLNKELPGNVDSVANMFGWIDDDKIVYSSYGLRDPFMEVKNTSTDGIVIDNLTLAGVVYENEKPMALFIDSKVKGLSYNLYEGDSVKNGKILKITKNSVLFLLQEYGVSRRYTMSLPDKYGDNK